MKTAGPVTGQTGTDPVKRDQKYHLKSPVRIVTAASLFDGHDAAINIMRRILQSTGAEVIHLGHNRSVREVVHTAIQEDAQAIAISSYQGGHVEYLKYCIDLLKKLKSSHIKVFAGGGGTITPDEIRELEDYGVEKIYTPEDGRLMGLQGIVNDLLKRAESSPLANIDWDNLKNYRNHPRALAQVVSCFEADSNDFQPDQRELFENLSKQIQDCSAKNHPAVIGITGPGGSGKSSFTDELILRILAGYPEDRVGVIAFDPTRKKTGGALLGDRLRMNSLHNDRTFMRSLATRSGNQAVSRITNESIEVFRAAGFDWILVETGGIGQADTSLVDDVDINIYLMTSEYGASTQLEKINMLDFADLVILNKFEKAGSLDALTEVRKQFRRNHPEFESVPVEKYPIFGTIASRFADSGINQAFEHLDRIRKETETLLPFDGVINPDADPVTPMIPNSRIQYLSEIANEVRDYKKEVDLVSRKIQRIQELESLLEEEDLSEGTTDELKSILETESKSIPENCRQVLSELKRQMELYRQDIYEYQVRNRTFEVKLTTTSLSGNPIRKVSLPVYRSDGDLMRFGLLENLPGYFPYTAGVFPFKRTDEDPKRMFAGEGTPERTNRRFHLLCEGETSKRLSTAFDSVTLYGEDPAERPDIFGKIGESGVNVCTLEDAKKLYAGFDLCHPNVSVSMTINGPAPIILAFFFNAAIDQQVDQFEKENGRKPTEEEWNRIKQETLKQVRGTVQADILKEDQAQNTCIFSTPFALKMMGDMQEYFIRNEIRNFYSVSISGYHIAEAGANPISQLAFTMANGFTFIEYYLARGLDIDDFAPNLSFFFSNGLDPEYTVIGRVARRIWAIALKNLYGANDRSQKLKYHIQTSGRSLHAQEISFNDIRTTLQALIAHFDFCNSLHTNAYDEAVTLPTEESVRRAMAIQMIITKELGWAKNENPLQGSFFIEELTDLVEEAVLREFERISLRGGVLGAMETQYQRNQIQEESLYYERLKHSGELPIVGVNTFLNPDPESVARMPDSITRSSDQEKEQQITNLKAYQEKNRELSPVALENLKQTARTGGNIFESLMEAARVCSLGQISSALYEIGGEYRRSS